MSFAKRSLRLKMRQGGITCARRITLDWIGRTFGPGRYIDGARYLHFTYEFCNLVDTVEFSIVT